jgi:seryl-tRNA synthetase
MSSKLNVSAVSECCSSFINLSLASSRQNNTKLVSKIYELEAQLYEANRENQELRMKRNELEGLYGRKKMELFELRSSKTGKVRRNNSQRHTVCSQGSEITSPRHTRTPLLLNCKVQPITGLEQNFEALGH